MKTKKLFMFFSGLIVGATIICVMFLIRADIDWKEYIEKYIAPNIILFLSTVFTIYLTVKPVINLVISAAEKFKSSSKILENNIKNESRIVNLEEKLCTIETTVKNTEKIVRLGFCNTNELVTKGYANEIAKVGGENESQNYEKIEFKE